MKTVELNLHDLSTQKGFVSFISLRYGIIPLRITMATPPSEKLRTLALVDSLHRK